MKNLKELSPIAQVVEVQTTYGANHPKAGEPYVDKNGREFRIIKLQGLTSTIQNIGGIDYPVRGLGRTVSLTQWKENYLNNTQDPFYDAKVGEHLAVSIMTAENLNPYEITDQESGEVREVTSYTFPVIQGQNPLTLLKNRGYSFADGQTVSIETTEDEQVEAPELA